MATADGSIRVSIDIDSSPIENELYKISKSLQNLAKTIKETFNESAVKNFAKYCNDLSSGFSASDVYDYIGAISSLLSIIVALAGEEILASQVTIVFGSAMQFSLGPLGLVILAIVALITIVVLLIKNFDLIKEKAIEIWTAISDFFSELWATITEAVTVAWQAIVDFIVGLWAGISETAIEVWTVIAEFFTQLWATITEAVTVAWQAIVDFIVGLWIGISETAIEVWTVIADFFTQLWVTITETAILAWQTIVSFILGIWTGISETAIAVWTAIADFFTQLWITIATAVTTAWQAIIDSIVGIWTGISEITIELWTPIADFFTGLLDGIKLTFTNAWESIKTVWGVVATWFTDNIINPIQKAFEGFKTAVVGAWNGIWDGIKGVINSILGGIERFINGIINGVNGLINGLNSVLSLGGKVTEALGLGDLGFVSPLGTISLPRLAQGAVIPPNREFAAILGDQKHGLNIETPLDTMVEAFKTALSDMGSTSNAPIYITVESTLDGKAVARNQVKYLPTEYNRVGPSAVKVGA